MAVEQTTRVGFVPDGLRDHVTTDTSLVGIWVPVYGSFCENVELFLRAGGLRILRSVLAVCATRVLGRLYTGTGPWRSCPQGRHP